MDNIALEIYDLTYRYPGAAMTALSEVSCSIRAGECICLSGDSGCGKTTLLLAVKGLLRGTDRSGTIKINVQSRDEEWGIPAGLVFQNAESQILCTTVAEEVAFGPENLCAPPAEIARRVRDALQAVGLDDYETRHVERFSAGQKQRLTIAAVLSMKPSLLLLDEPTSQLDRHGKQELCTLLAGLKQLGYTIIMTEHDPRPFETIIDRYLPMADGRIGHAVTTLPNRDGYTAHCTPVRTRGTAEEMPAAISVQGLCLSYPETGRALQQVDLQVMPGERIHLFGSNGAGKSSLLRCLAGLENTDSGSVKIAGIAAPRPEQLPGKVGLLFQNPTRQLFAESVYEEVAFSLRRLGIPGPDIDRGVTETLKLCGIGHLAERAPLTLSFGEQHRVALAAIIAPRPGVLLLDEPFAGLDFLQRLTLLAILAEMPGRYGTTILIASHDDLPDDGWADRNLLLKEGALVELGS